MCGVSVQVPVMGLLHLPWILSKVMCSEATGIMGKALEEARDVESTTGPGREQAQFSIYDG